MAELSEGPKHTVKIKYSHTIQLRQYEPVTFEVEMSVEAQGDPAKTYEKLDNIVEAKFLTKFEELEALRK